MSWSRLRPLMHALSAAVVTSACGGGTVDTSTSGPQVPTKTAPISMDVPASSGTEPPPRSQASSGGVASAAPVVMPPPSATAINSTEQQILDQRLDAAVVDDCLAKLDVIVTEYEHIRNPTDDEATSAMTKLADTRNHQCGLLKKVEADPRYAALAVRVRPILARATAARERREAADAARQASAMRGSLDECAAALGEVIVLSGTRLPRPDGRCWAASLQCERCCHIKNASATAAHCTAACASRLTAYSCQ